MANRGRPGINLSGKRINKFIVTDEKEHRIDGVYWYCLCDCGNTFIGKASDLSKGKYTSCGCYRKVVKAIEKDQASINRLCRRYRLGAKTRNYAFDLEIEDFEKLIFDDCHYCGIEPSTVYKEGGKVYNGMTVYNGIDRVDNSKGYILGNVVPCCKTCNIAKASLGYQEFLNWIDRVSNHVRRFR